MRALGLALILALPQWAALLHCASGAGNTVTSYSTAVTSTTSGSTLLASVTTNTTVTASLPTCTGCTWVQDVASGGANAKVAVFRTTTLPASTVSVTFNVSALSNSSGVVCEFSDNITGVDVAGTPAGSFSSTCTAGAITTTNANDLLWATGGWTWSDAPSAGPTNTFTTALNINDVGTRRSTVTAYRLVAATGSYSTAWTEGGDDQAGVMVSYAVGGGGGGGGGGSPAASKRKKLQKLDEML